MTAQEHEAASVAARVAASLPHVKAVRRYLRRRLAALRALEAPDIAAVELLDELVQEVEDFLTEERE